jgi:TRAP-type C4-dicarboxylate transport system substrate-binding protein
MTPEMLLFSKRQWDKLPEADRKIILDAARESVPYMRRLWAEREKKSLEIVQKAGAEVVETDKASFQGVMQPVYDRFVTTDEMRDLVKRIQAVK